MNNGIYTSTAGMLAAMERLDITANNLANFNTAGFKTDLPFEQLLRFYDQGPHPAKEQPIVAGREINFAPGAARTTGRKLDFMIEGEGFFTVQAPEGGELYTRNGSLDISQTRELVSSQGLPLLDRFNKKIRLAGQDYAITSRGEIFVDGNYLTSLKIVKLNKEMDLEKAGNNLIKATGAKPETVGSPTLAQGMLEASNSDLMAEMTNMIVIQRSYEFQSRVLDTIVGQLLRRTVSDIPKPL